MSKIIAAGHHAPETIIPNSYFESFLDTTSEWIEQRSGIRERRKADKETCYDMGKLAVENLASRYNINFDEIDVVIATSSSQELIMPCMAAKLKAEFNIPDHALTFDLNSACAGFTHALLIADGYMKQHGYKKTLIVSTEKYSNILDYTDRSTCILFGDGAGAVVLENTDSFFVGGTLTQNDDKNAIVLDRAIDEYIHMEGTAVYKWVTVKLSKVLKEAKGDLELDGYFMHQANVRILHKIAETLGEPFEKFPNNMEFYGNTSSASIPILLSEQLEQNLVKPGRYMLSGFGAGLNFSYIIMDF